MIFYIAEYNVGCRQEKELACKLYDPYFGNLVVGETVEVSERV